MGAYTGLPLCVLHHGVALGCVLGGVRGRMRVGTHVPTLHDVVVQGNTHEQGDHTKGVPHDDHDGVQHILHRTSGEVHANVAHDEPHDGDDDDEHGSMSSYGQCV
jgi:hypothetical protein